MIYLVTAMYAEAHALITRFQLKKEISHTHFQVFLNRDADLCLIISGTGSVPAAAAVSSICTEYGAGQGDFLMNVGVCAQMQNENLSKTAQCPASSGLTGQIFLCSKIKELSTGKTFYPDILYRHKFTEAQIITGTKPYEKIASDKMTSDKIDSDKTAADKIAGTDFCLYDMEAAAVYQAGAYYLGPHQMSFLKIISDDGTTENVTPGQIKGLIDQNMDSIADYITNLQSIAQENHPEEIFQENTTQKTLGKLCLDMHCSKTMSESVSQYIRYCILSDIDYISVLEEMYRSGKLPCKDKREGKKCFEELKERLL